MQLAIYYVIRVKIEMPIQNCDYDSNNSGIGPELVSKAEYIMAASSRHVYKPLLRFGVVLSSLR